MTIATESGYQLELGALPLMENDANLAAGGYLIEALGEGATFGNGTPVVETIQSLLRDGDLTSTQKYGNRIASFQVRITAESAQGLADGEALIAAELDKPNTLTWRMPNGAPPTLFDVVRSWSEFEFEDLREVRRQQRIFLLSFECLPDGRSEASVSFTWTGPSATLRAVTSTTGWTVASGTRSSVDQGGGVFAIQASTSNPTFTVTGLLAPLKDYLWIRSNADAAGGVGTPVDMDLTIDGVVIPDTSLFNVGMTDASDAAKRFIIMADVSAWRGTTPTSISFKVTSSALNGRVYGFATTSYPNLPGGLDVGEWGSDETPTVHGDRGPALPNFGIGRQLIVGSSRAPCWISFTAPAGGAFVYTAPDPAFALRTRGLPENAFGVFDIADVAGAQVEFGSTVMWFPEGEHFTQVGRTASQPSVLFPDGIWPQAGTGVTTIGDDTAAVQYGYPADPDAALTFYSTSGAKNVVSPSPSLPMGYQGGAVAHENHVLHPGYSGVGVLDVNGDPVTATYYYYPHWKHHAAV